LIVKEWIRAWFPEFNTGASFLIKDIQQNVEPPEHFHEPLMHERFGHEDERALHATGKDESMENQARLDRLPEADFIR